MKNADYKRGEALAATAERLERDGQVAEARDAYDKASHAQEAALAAFPEEKAKTRGILVVNTVSLAFRAKTLDRAEELAHRWLADRALPTFARSQLRELLEVVWDEIALAKTGYEYAGGSVSVALRGGEVGAGTAPADEVMGAIGGLYKLLYRIVEFVGGLPYRTRGSAPPWVQGLCVARVSQPQVGSYRFTLQLARPIRQTELFEEAPEVRPERVTELLVRLPLLAVAQPEAVQAEIPDERYRQALLKLTRNVVPDGKRVGQVELARMSDRLATDPHERVVLVPASKPGISAAINRDRPAAAPDEETQTEEVVGVLRALHLDHRWLEVHVENGAPLRCETSENELDDVIGPLVNRRVRVRGVWTTGRRQFRLRDIFRDDDGE